MSNALFDEELRSLHVPTLLLFLKQSRSAMPERVVA